MNYDRERAYYEQECLEEMIRMRDLPTRKRLCEECGINQKDGPRLCPGCEAYYAHTGQI